MDRKSGFNSVTSTFHSLRSPIDLPHEDAPLSATEYAFSLRANSPLPDSISLINPITHQRICYSDLIRRTNSLAGYLQKVTKLSKNDVAFVLSPNSIPVAPVELEQLLLSHPDIADAAVIPYPDEEAGQVPMAFVARQRQSSLNQAQIMDFVAERVAPYKKIRRVAFVDSIPKNPSGKILRKELRKVAVPAGSSSRL